MKQPVYLLSLTMSGIKNIYKDIKIQLYKKTVSEDFDISDYRIKAIYGENGSGKTAIVWGVQILRSLLTNDNYLKDSANQDFLREIINKRTQLVHLECEYYCNSNDTPNIYKYCIYLKKNDADEYYIASESLSKRSASYSTSKYKEVFRVEEGELYYDTSDDALLAVLKASTANLLSESTLFITLYNSRAFGRVKDSELMGYLTTLYLLGMFMITSLDDSDRQSKGYTRKTFTAIMEDLPGNKMEGVLMPRLDIFSGDVRIISVEDFENYELEVAKLERFIKLFKHDLQHIEIDKRERDRVYECTLVMNYGDYRVHIGFESTGIKRLIRIFDYLTLAMDGKIVFIDEMDSNINDVYLCKIVEFFKLYGKGQLCFTTHSTSPMEVLKDSKNSIDFLSSDSRIVPWKKNGNYTPESLYRRGMIEYLPFNIEAEDFLGILGD